MTTISRRLLARAAGLGLLGAVAADSYLAFRERTAAWSRISIKAVLEAREG